MSDDSELPAVESWFVVCDETNNSAEDIEQGRLYVDILVPVRVVTSSRTK